MSRDIYVTKDDGQGGTVQEVAVEFWANDNGTLTLAKEIWMNVEGVITKIFPKAPFIAGLNAVSGDTVTIPFVGKFNVLIDWGDGTRNAYRGQTTDMSTPDTTTCVHTYSSDPTGDLTISGEAQGILSRNITTHISEVKAWGDLGWETMNSAFYGSSDIASVTATDFVNVKNVRSWGSSFRQCPNLIQFDTPFDWDTHSYDDMGTSEFVSMQQMFMGSTKVTSIAPMNWTGRMHSNFSAMFSGCDLATFDVTGWDILPPNCSGLLTGNSNLDALDVSGWDTSNVTNMSAMFDKCSTLTALDVTSWDTSNVTTMVSMFRDCAGLVTAGFDPSGFDTAKVRDMRTMFNGCLALTNLNLSGWDISACANINGMFSNCSVLTATGTRYWDTSLVTSFALVFGNCPAYKNIQVASWSTASATTMENMLSVCGITPALYADALIGWAAQPQADIPTGILFSANQVTYEARAQDTRDILTSAPNNWTIIDAGSV